MPYPVKNLIKKTPSLPAISLLLLCLIISACAGAQERTARRGLNAFVVEPGMTIYLPDGWQAEDPATYNASIDNLSAKLPLPLPAVGMGLFQARRTTAEGKPAAVVGVGLSNVPGLTNDVLSALTVDEKQQIVQAMRLVMQGMSSQLNMPLAVTNAEFKPLGRYEPMVFSGESQEADKQEIPGWNSMQLRFHIAFFFMPKGATLLTYVSLPANNVDADKEFARILAAFEPDANYKPASPPARKEGEAMTQYILRANATGAAQ